VHPGAYEAYLKGRFHLGKLTPSDLDHALKYFELALERDPSYAPAYAGIAAVWIGRNQNGYASPSEATPFARAAATKALELDGSLALAHYALAAVAWAEWDWEVNESELRKSIQLDPSFPDAHTLYGVILYLVRRYEDALAQFQSALNTTPDSAVVTCGLWYTYNMTGKPEQALKAAQRCLDHYGNDVSALLAQGYSEAGYAGGMRRVADRLAAGVRGVYVAPIDVFLAYLHAGEKNLALEWLSKSVDARDPNVSGAVRDPFAKDSLGDDPRFQGIVRRTKLPI
jgi:Tfp pilus assembly protein PilF